MGEGEFSAACLYLSDGVFSRDSLHQQRYHPFIQFLEYEVGIYTSAIVAKYFFFLKYHCELINLYKCNMFNLL